MTEEEEEQEDENKRIRPRERARGPSLFPESQPLLSSAPSLVHSEDL